MTAAGDICLAVAYTQVGNSENPPFSNRCSPYTDPWGAGAWCAMFYSWCREQGGFPFPPLNGPHGFSYCPSGTTYFYETPGAQVGPDGVEPGDCLIFSWEPWHIEGGIAVCSYGAYAGTAAGDHTGFFARWTGDGGMVTVEGNTSAGSWDNGGTVMERFDRHLGQICAYGRDPALGAGGGGGPIIVAYVYGPEREDIVAYDSGGHVWHKWLDAGGWHPGGDNHTGGWEELGGTAMNLDPVSMRAVGPPSAAWYGDEFHVYWPQPDGNIRRMAWNGTTGWGTDWLAGPVSSIAIAVKSNIRQV